MAPGARRERRHCGLSRPEAELEQLIVPLDETFDDYAYPYLSANLCESMLMLRPEGSAFSLEHQRRMVQSASHAGTGPAVFD